MSLDDQPNKASLDPDGRRRLVRRILLTLGPALVLAIGGFAYLTGGRYVSTENAYIKSDLVAVSAEISGPIIELGVDDNDPVAVGDLLFRIDPRPFQIAFDQAQARLDATRDEIEGMRAHYRQKTEELALARTDYEYAGRERNRQAALAENGYASRSRLDQVQTSLDTAAQRIAMLTQEQAQILSQLSGDADIAVETHPHYLEARAAHDTAILDLERTRVRAPFDGIIGRAPELGQYVTAGRPVLSVIGTEDLWIEANFKETDLANVRPGQPVEISVDTYGAREWRGTVESIAHATGAEVSILPAQNASGNWVKVVQRIAVRIRVEPDADAPPLHAGMSTRVEIDTDPPETAGIATSDQVGARAAEADTGP